MRFRDPSGETLLPRSEGGDLARRAGLGLLE